MTSIQVAKTTDAGTSGTIAWVAPFAVFVGIMALEKALPFSPAILYPTRAAVVLATILATSRRVVRWAPTQAIASIALGIGVFFLWIGPDLLWPGMRNHWLFHNSILGSASSSLPEGLKTNWFFIAVRLAGTAVLVPVAEELFWRGWMMRWLIDPSFQRVPLGTFSPLSFWVTAVLFASEHGSYWEVGLVTGMIYNWWLVRTRSLADCILTHAVTNGCLGIYVLGWNQWQYWL
jgi:CAAX prenyl protease-like protein